MKKTKTRKKKILIIVLCIAAALLVAGDWILSVMIYRENFNRCFESYEPLMLYVEDFDGLQCTQYEFNEEAERWIESLDYDYEAAENKERFMEDKAEYIHDHLDRDRWCNSLDSGLFEDFVEFYDEKIQ